MATVESCSLWGFDNPWTSPHHQGVSSCRWHAFPNTLTTWLNSVVCVCVTTAVRRFREHRLCSIGGRIRKMHNSTAAVGVLTEIACICSNLFTGKNHPGCAELLYPMRSYARFSACSNGLSRQIQHLFTSRQIQHLFTGPCHLSLGRVLGESQVTVTRHLCRCQCWL